MTHGSNGNTLAVPENKEAERAFIGSLLLLPEAVDLPEVAAVQAGDILDPQFAIIFRHIREARDEGREFGSIFASMTARGEYSPEIRQAIIEANEAVVNGSGAKYYADKIREAAEHRSLWQLQHQLQRQIDDRLPPADVRGYLSSYLDSATAAPGRIEYESLTLADLERAAEPEYLIDGILESSQPGVIGGQWKAGKTTMGAALAYSLATEQPYLGKFTPNRTARVGMFSGEARAPQLKRLVARIAAFHGDDNPWAHDGLIFSCERLPKIGSRPYMDALVRWIDRNRLEVCIIDPGYAALSAIGDSAGNYYKVAELLFQVTELQAKTGCVMLLVPHMTKGKNYDPPMLSDIMWSGFAEWSGQWLLFGKRREWNDQTGEHWLWLVAGGRSGHASTWGLDFQEGTGGNKFFDVQLIEKGAAFATAIDAQQEQRTRAQHHEQLKAEQAIRDAFMALGDGYHVKSHVLERTGTSGRGKAIAAAWATMLRRKEIRVQEGACRGANNKPCDGYSLPPKA